MGLRTASVRHPHVEVMAPALTESAKIHFSLPSKKHVEKTPVDFYASSKCIDLQQSYFQIENSNDICFPKVNNDHISDKLTNDTFKQLISQSGINHNLLNNIMNRSSPMCDQENKMGIQKTVLSLSNMSKPRLKNKGSQLFAKLGSVISENEIICSSDLASPAKDVIPTFKVIEGEKLSSAGKELCNDNEIFPMDGADLTNNFSPFEKDLLENVDVISIGIEDQHDAVEPEKEYQAKDLLKEIERRQIKIERKLDFLRRRAHKFQSRLLGHHVSCEISGIYENVYTVLKKPKDIFELNSPRVSCENIAGIMKVFSSNCAKNLIRKLEMTSAMQANSLTQQKVNSKYFGSGSVEFPLLKSISSGTINVMPWQIVEKGDLHKIANQLKTQLFLSQKEVDSEVTDSSSGGESCDEMQSYNNPHQQYLSVQKRALWKYSSDRAAIAARWTWLQAQIADIEYRIRLHADLYKQIRTNKGALVLYSSPDTPSQTAVNGYRGQLPGSSVIRNITHENNSYDYQCARTRPLTDFKKRKLLQISGLHAVSKRAARPSTMKCGCVHLNITCAVCTGRSDPTHPRDPLDTLSKSEKIALLDASFHPVFSLSEDISQSIHLSAIMKTSEWQQRSSRMKTTKVLTKLDRLESKSLDTIRRFEHRKKYGKLLRSSTTSFLAEKIKHKVRGRRSSKNSLNRLQGKRLSEKDESLPVNLFSADNADEEVESLSFNSNSGQMSLASPNSSPLLQMQSITGLNKKGRIDSYDIDNIVIPYSVAASTRVEKLKYKEILTPKWRIAETYYESFFTNKNNGVRNFSNDRNVEDLSEEAVVVRHEKCEHEEKKRFLSYLKIPLGYGRSRYQKRTDSRAESSGANTPDPMSPHNLDQQELTNSPLTSPPDTPLPGQLDESISLPSIAVMRRRTVSQTKLFKDRELKEENICNFAADVIEVAPYEKRIFPINDETYDRMLKNMPENHLFLTNSRSQDSSDHEDGNYLDDERVCSADSESTESAIGDGEEDPNDPEWSDIERNNREKYKR